MFLSTLSGNVPNKRRDILQIYELKHKRKRQNSGTDEGNLPQRIPQHLADHPYRGQLIPKSSPEDPLAD